MHKNQQVRQIINRNERIRWWVQATAANPSGLVPIPTASRILGVSITRVRTLIEEGRFTVVDGMPGGNERDRFIPLEQLITAPFAMNHGRPGLYGPRNRRNKHLEARIDEWHALNNKKALEEFYERYPEKRPKIVKKKKKTPTKRKPRPKPLKRKDLEE